MVTDTSIQEKNYKRNLISFTLINIFWQMGDTFVVPYTALIYFLKELNARTIVVSSIVPIFLFFNTFPSMFWGIFLRNDKNIRFKLVLYCAMIYVPYFVIFLMLEFMNIYNSIFIYILLMLFMVSNVGTSIESLAFRNYVANSVPQKRRGTLWGIVFSSGYLISLIAFPFMNLLNNNLDVYTYYKYSFLIFFVFAFIGSLFFLLTKGPKDIVYSDNKEVMSLKNYFKTSFSIMKKNKNFRNLIFIMYLNNFTIVVASFLMVYIIDKFDISNAQNIQFTILFIVIFGLGTLLAGKLGDKLGFKKVLLLSSIINPCGVILLLLSPKLIFVFFIFPVIVLSQALEEQVIINMPIECCPEENKVQYIGIFNTFTSLSIFFPIILGGLIDSRVITLPVVLSLSAVFVFIAFLLFIFVFKEPRTIENQGECEIKADS
jgi:MFS family permease